jgi:ribosomal protein L18
VFLNLLSPFPSPLFFFFHPSSNTEEDVVLKTNKHIYSQLLRASANKGVTLMERIDVVIRLLEQLALGDSGASVTSGSAVQ